MSMASRAVRQRATADMFKDVERRWGNLDKLLRPDLRVERSAALSTQSLRRLFALETLALVIPNFVQRPEPLADAIQEAGETARNWSVTSSRGMESSDVKAVGGTPYNVAVSTNDTERYFAEDVPNAKKWVRSLPGGDALDRLRCDLDDAWPGGCSSKKNAEGRAHHVGLGRVMAGPTQWSQGFVHVDELAPMSPAKGHFSANLYLKLPSEGGHLELWPLQFESRWEFYTNAHTLSKLVSIDEEAQRELRARLPPPIVLEVAPGDLVMLSVQRPHAVQGWTSGDSRASLQSFVNFAGDDAALTLEA